MPKVQADRLSTIGERLLVAAGAKPDHAVTIARHTVGANLAGHDSHGIMLVPTYIDRINKNHIEPLADYEVTRETDATITIDGHWGFGYVVSEYAMTRVIEKAKAHGLGAATVFRQSHVGRVADYPLMAVGEGMIGIMTADSGRSAKQVVPFGGRETRLGTNPICIAMPSNLEGPLYVDMATSAVAAGKINVAVARNQSVPEGWLIDKDGNATTDPTALRNGGALLPLGGNEGYKGYGLSVMVEILSGILPGLGFGHEPSGRHNDGIFMAAFRVDAFLDLDQFKREVTEFAEYLKATPKAKGFNEIYYPGEIEHVTTKRKLVDGIDVEDSTWNKLTELAQEYGVAAELGLP
ncbi:MAG: Ldh family oxidoreductase [Chloroflexi bacterium]|nr:Ldh family oxidoreductase [Chloroflexota bacterium]MDA1174461.1 Ldh family oxidoreductase [Chloroflexota bacterium]